MSDKLTAQPGSGQRQYTTLGLSIKGGPRAFVKGIWRDERRLFFEAALYGEAHKRERPAGLMEFEAYGYVLYKTRNPIRTACVTSKHPEEPMTRRYKLRTIIKNVGLPLRNCKNRLHRESWTKFLRETGGLSDKC
jgi:hypothetical protein